MALRESSPLTIAGLLCRLFAGLLIAAAPAHAQPENEQSQLSTTLTLGFDSASPARRADAWAPLSALLENRGKAIQGRLVAQVYYGQESTDILYTCPVDLPTGSRKRYHMAVFLPGEGAEVQVSLEYEGKAVLLGQLVAPALEDQLVAAVTRERDSLNFLATAPEELEEVQIIRRILYVDAQTLPTQWIAYHGLDALIWAGRQPETSLSPEQLAACRDWLMMGGRLILFVGSLWQEFAETAWAEFAPLELTGSETLPAGTMLEGPLLREPQALVRPVVVSTGVVHEALQPRVLLRASDIPVVVEVDWGAGRVLYCAVEPQPLLFTSVEATLQLWDMLLAGLGALPVYVTNQLDPIVSRYLRFKVPVKLPSAWFIAGFLGLYICLVVPVNYLVFKRYRRLEWAWLTVPVWAVLFTVAAYHIGAIYQRGTVTLTTLSVIEAFPDSRRGRTTSFTSIYSPVRHWYDVQFPGRDVFPMVVRDTGFFTPGLSSAPVENLAVEYSPQAAVIKDVLIHHWSQRMVKVAHSVDLGQGVSVDLRWQGDKLVGTVTNRTPYTIRDPSLYVMDRRYVLGSSLRSRQTCEVPGSFERCDLSKLEELLDRMPVIYGSPRSRPRFRSTDVTQFAPIYRYWLYYDPSGKDLSLLTGFIDHLFVEPQLDRPIGQEEAEALLAVLFNACRWPAGLIRIPPASWYIQRSYIRGMLPVVAPRGSELFRVFPGQTAPYTLMTDFSLRGCQVRRLRIVPSLSFIRRLRPGTSKGDVIISVQNRVTKEWEELSWRFDRDQWTVEADYLADPQEFVNLRAGSIGVQITNRSRFPIGVGDSSLEVMLEVEYISSFGSAAARVGA